MYEVDDKDRVVVLENAPKSSPGAPMPLVLADERTVVLAFYLHETNAWWDGTTEGPESEEALGFVRFNGRRAHMFGPPNDEAFRGHPLAGRGLHPYGAFQIEHSSWIRRLERMNSVHRDHQPERYWSLRHFIFAFHGSTFECVCDSFDAFTTRGSIAGALPEMARLLGWSDE